MDWLLVPGWMERCSNHGPVCQFKAFSAVLFNFFHRPWWSTRLASFPQLLYNGREAITMECMNGSNLSKFFNLLHIIGLINRESYLIIVILINKYAAPIKFISTTIFFFWENFFKIHLLNCTYIFSIENFKLHKVMYKALDVGCFVWQCP